MAAVDANQPRAKANTTAITCLGCVTEHNNLVGGGIGVTTRGRRANKRRNKAPLAFRAQIRVKWYQKQL
jgi:hypothetical protein